MILRLLETILVFYCAFSYVASSYVMYIHWNDPAMKAEKGARIFAAVIFIAFAPIFMLDVIYERLTGNRGVF